MSVFTLQVNMTRGELTPYAQARVDTDHYQAALALARNVIVLRYGGVTRTPGTLFRGMTKYANRKSRFIPFEFNRNQVYSIEAGYLYFRFWTPAGRVESPPGTPVEVATPYAEADLRYIQVRQSADVIYVFCRGYQPRILTRLSETNWTLGLYTPEDGPYLDINTTGTTLTPSGYGSFAPKMTGASTPSGTVTSSFGDASAWKAFDKDSTTQAILQNAEGGNGWVQYHRSAAGVCNAYWLQATSQASDDMFTSWSVQGSNDGATWVTIDSRDGQTGWAAAERRYFEFVNTASFEYLRLNFAGGGKGISAGSDTVLAEWSPNNADDTITLVASSYVGLNNDGGFVSSDVGRAIRLMGSDGRWRWAEITGVTNYYTVDVKLNGHALPDLSPIVSWRLGAWSDYTGWPSSVGIWEDRLFGARTDTDPLGVWGSVNAAYTKFRSSAPPVDDDSVSTRLTGGKLNDISWLNEGRDILAGTAGSLRAIGRNNPNSAFSPSNVRQRAETLTPAARAEPINIENVTLFLDYYEQRLYEAAYTYEIEGYLAREVSTLSEHLFAAGVWKIVYLSHPHKIIIGVRYDGLLVAFTYDREQKVTGGTLLDIGGFVEDAEQLTGPTGTDLWLTVRRTVNGASVRYVETLAEFWREDFTVQDVPVYGASALIYDGVKTDTVSGASHLRGETVGVWADGRDIGDAVVAADGTVVLPYDVEAEQIVIAKRMPWEVRTLRLAQIGNRDGSGLGRKVDIVEGYIDLYEAAGVSVGSLDGVDVLGFEDEAEQDPYAPVTLRTGMFPLRVDDSWRNNGVLVLKGDRMYPVTVRAIQLEVDGEP